MRLFRYLLILLAVPVQLMAIPAWARLTGASCNSCHQLPSLQLTATGLEFQRNGKRTDPDRYDKALVDWGNSTSLVFEDQLTSTKGGRPSTQASQPVLSIFSGGALSDHFSYTGIYHFNASSDATENLEEAFIQYNAPLAKGVFLSVRGGQFMPEVLRNFGLGPASYVETPLVLTSPVSEATPFTLGSAMRGVDLNLHWGAFDLAGGAFNPTTGGPDTNPTNHKDTYGALVWRFDDYASGIGCFRYDGKNLVFDTPGDPTSGLAYEDNFYRNGILARFIRDKWRVMGAFFGGAHVADATGARTRNQGWYLLTDLDLHERIGAFARYDKLRPNVDDRALDAKMVAAGLNGMLFREAKVGARWVAEASQTDQNGTKSRTALLYVVLAF